MIYLLTALVVGALDISYAIVASYLRVGTSPQRLLQSVAFGWFGRGAYEGGWATAAAGLGFHFFIAFTITAIFFAASIRLRWLTARPFLAGPIYGIGVYVVMNYVVIPLSRIGLRPMPPMSVLIPGLLVHIFLIGMPIALGARRWRAAASTAGRMAV